MSASARANEPSMEEILASIRRIISDEVAAEPQASRSENPRVAASLPADAMADVPAAVMDANGVEAHGGAEAISTAATPPSGAPVRRASPAIRAAGEPRSPAIYSSYAPAGRSPAIDPFVSSRRQSAAAAALAPQVAEPASALQRPLVAEASRPERAPTEALLAESEATDDADLGASLSAALFDLSLVEQAVQAELATMTADVAPPTPVADDDTAVADSSDVGYEPAGMASVPASDTDTADSSATSLPATSAPEIDDMQVQAKAAHVPQRAAGSEPAEERRAIEARVNEPARPAEPRFLAAAARATSTPADAAPLPEAPSRLVSTATNAAVSTAFGTLARTVASNSRTVDDLVTEALRPMLKAWLDENLPTLVERLVRAEIERVARQGQ